jgi:hypothetical protein
MTAWRDVNPITPFDVTPTTVIATGATMSFPTITTVTDGAMIINGMSPNQDVATTAQLSAWTNASLASITEGHDQTQTNGGGGGVGFAYGIKTSAGAVSATTVTVVATENAQNHSCATIALRQFIGGSVSITQASTVAVTGSKTSEAEPEPSTDQTFIDFNDYADISAVLAEWTPRWSSTALDYSLSLQGGKNCLKLSGAQANHLISCNALNNINDNVEIVFKHSASVISGMNAFSPDLACWIGVNGAFGYYSPTGHSVFTWISGTAVDGIYDVAGVTLSANTWYWTRFKKANGNLYYRCWQEVTVPGTKVVPFGTISVSTALLAGTVPTLVMVSV